MFSTCCFLVFKSFHKQDICHWATASIVVADGFAVLAFWRILHSAIIHKVAQCVIPMQIRYILIYFIHHIRTGPLHMFKLFSLFLDLYTSSTAQGHFRTNHSHSFLRAKSWLIVLHRTQSIANIPAKTVNNYHISLSTTAKDTSRQVPCNVFSTKLKNS